MLEKSVSGMISILLLISMLTLVFDIKASANTGSPMPDELTESLLLEFDFPAPVVTEGPVYDAVSMLGLPKYGASGEPVLPFRTVEALIPQGKEVQGVVVTTGSRIVLEGRFNLEYGKTLIPISSNISVVDEPSQMIYSSLNPFPGAVFSQPSTQCLRGYRILILKLHPVQYIPKKGELYYFETMTVTVSLKENGIASPLFRNLPQDKAFVSDIVDNPDEANTYTKTAPRMQLVSLADPSFSYNYVIITNAALVSSFKPLIDWKIQKGLNATIVLVENIINDPDYHSDGMFGDGCGTPKLNDTQAHIRNFIKDAYQNWGTEYVLLGGDDETIPSRGVYVYAGGYTDYNIPCDMYYGALDGGWDNDNDTIFGEAVYHWSGPENGTAGEEADFFAEAYIGRATVDTAEEATNFVNKIVAYEQNTDSTYLDGHAHVIPTGHTAIVRWIECDSDILEIRDDEVTWPRWLNFSVHNGGPDDIEEIKLTVPKDVDGNAYFKFHESILYDGWWCIPDEFGPDGYPTIISFRADPDGDPISSGESGEFDIMFSDGPLGGNYLFHVYTVDNGVPPTMYLHTLRVIILYSCTKALMIGQTLDTITEGGNAKDLVTDIMPQYTTTRLYDRDGTFSPTAVINEMNSGTHIVNHDGHAWYSGVMGLTRSDVDSLTNTEYFMAYSIGCYSAAFDEATSGPDEAIAEHFIFNSHGAFAYIGNSRYGWYCPGSINGPGDRYDRSFFNVLHQGTKNAGKALQLSKENLFDQYTHRWTYFTLNLIGDPETEIVTEIKAPTAHFETRTDSLTPPQVEGLVNLQGIAKQGNAANATFSHYTIEYGRGTNPTYWSSYAVNLTGSGESEVTNGTLASWNTSQITSGLYTLRLRVFDSNGITGEDRWIVLVTTGWAKARAVYSNTRAYSWEGHTSMATDSFGNLFLVNDYYNTTTGYYEIQVSKSSDGGNTWSRIKRAYDSTHNLCCQSIAIDPYSNDIFVAVEREWTSTDHDIFVLRYVDGIWSWSPVANTLGSDDRYPSVTSEYQYGSVNWQYISYEYVHTYDDRDLMFAKSTDHGSTWSIEKLHGDLPDYNVHTQTSIINAEGYIYIAYRWGTDYGSTCEIRVDRSTDYGDSWTQYTDIDGRLNDCSFPSIAATHGGSAVMVAFQYTWSVNDIDVCYSYSTDKGATWTKGYGLFVSGYENETRPAVIADGGGMMDNNVMGYFHAFCQMDYYIGYKKAHYTGLSSWSQLQIANERWVHCSLAVTTQFRNGSEQFYPCVAWIDKRTYDVYYSTPGADICFDSDPSGRTLDVDDNPHIAPFTLNLIAGYNHTINAPSPQYAGSNTRYVFESWSDSGAQSHNITASAFKENINAYFNVQYALYVSTYPSGLTPEPIVSPPGIWQDNGTLVSCIAQNICACVFDYWLVDGISQGLGINPIAIMMNSSHSAIAFYLYEHDLEVSLGYPIYLRPGDSSPLDVTVHNLGWNNETDVKLFLLVNGSVVYNETIQTLFSGTSQTLNYLWTPTVEAVYNVTGYTSPVAGENITINNVATKMVPVGWFKGCVLFDQTHGSDSVSQYSTWVTALTERNCIVNTLITSPITPSMLRGCNVLVIPQAHDPYSYDELSTIHDFVFNGGGLLVIGDDYPDIYTNLTSFVGISWASGGTSGTTTDITHHIVALGVSSVYIDAPVALMHVAGFAQDIIRDVAGNTMLAVSQQFGRVIGFADEGSLWNYGISYEDNLLLANNMIDWLLGRRAMVYVDPENVTRSVGETFTIDVVIADVANLYGIDIQFKWDPSILEYMNHTLKIPVETYPDGILHEPGILVMDDVDAVAGTYRVAYASMDPAPPFDGTGTIFEIAFYAKTNGTCVLEIFSSDLVDRSANSIPHNVMSGTVEIIPVHDLAVTDISILKNIVGQGYCTRINVTAANQGGFHEVCNITLFANGTIIDVASATVLSSSFTTISFCWNTTAWAKGNYTISAYAEPVPDETDLSDNTFIDGWVFVTIQGDVDGDRDVDIYDVVKITGIYGSKRGDPQFNPNSDLDDDGEIKIYDVVMCTSHYGQSW